MQYHCSHCRSAALSLTIISLLMGCREAADSRPAAGDTTAREKIRVACVGDSITYGLGIRNRTQNSYPAQLARMLGDRYEVRNFGVSGATMLRNGSHPYWGPAEFREATEYKPRLVVIMLGTNDAAPWNWTHRGEFAIDCGAMIDHFAKLPAKPRIWICLPPPLYEDHRGIKNEAIPLIEQVAREKGVPVIDLYTPLSKRPDLFPDGIHPDAEGAEIMASEIHRALTAVEPTVGEPRGPVSSTTRNHAQVGETAHAQQGSQPL
jgi:lysophospholipase L1-like esterase